MYIQETDIIEFMRKSRFKKIEHQFEFITEISVLNVISVAKDDDILCFVIRTQDKGFARIISVKIVDADDFIDMSF